MCKCYIISDIIKDDKNIIKQTCKRLGLTYAQLAKEIGYTEGNINKVASTGNISEPLKKSYRALLANARAKKRIRKARNLTKHLEVNIKLK